MRTCHATSEYPHRTHGVANPRPMMISTRRTGASRGFTLIEILLVVGLLGLLMALAWPMLQNQITASELPESADRVRDMLFMVRSEAALEHRRHRIRFVAGEQQPHIEYEPDPIERPGEWEPIKSAWARDPILLADVQVNEIRLGRPIYLKPVSREEGTDELEEQVEEEEEIIDELDDPTGENSDAGEEDEEIDEDRPLIMYEADGSTGWATLIVSKLPLEETVEEENDQLWIVLDGRTGLAKVREKVTEEQLADEEFYVQREKLELPDDLDVDNLSFEIGGDETTGAGGTESLAGFGLGDSNLGGQGGGFNDVGDAAGPGRGRGEGRIGNRAPQDGRGPAGRNPRRGRDDNPDGRRGADGRGGGRGGSATTSAGGNGNGGGNRVNGPNPHGGDDNAVDDLERKLQDADLTEEERENLRHSLGQGGG
ncbi:MAG: prepilin-type N-terminal cleavage/methylation domain-containing protein [Phycisphaerae bacterium]